MSFKSMKDSITLHLIQSLKCKRYQACISSHNRSSDASNGMTLLELLVVIVILGLLSLMTLPYALKYTNQARESEAINVVSAVNRAQQAYYLQHNDFTDLNQLKLGIPTATDNYTYSSTRNDHGGFVTADTEAVPSNTMRGFAGRAWINVSSGSAHIDTILCRGSAATTPTISGTTCP